MIRDIGIPLLSGAGGVRVDAGSGDVWGGGRGRQRAQSGHHCPELSQEVVVVVGVRRLLVGKRAQLVDFLLLALACGNLVAELLMDSLADGGLVSGVGRGGRPAGLDHPGGSDRSARRYPRSSQTGSWWRPPWRALLAGLGRTWRSVRNTAPICHPPPVSQRGGGQVRGG